MIGGGVRAGVAGPQDGGECLVGLVEVAEQRVESEAALVVASRLLLLGVGGDQGGVDVEDDLLGAGAGLPGPRPRGSAGLTDPIEDLGVDRLRDPMCSGLRGYLPEQRLLTA